MGIRSPALSTVCSWSRPSPSVWLRAFTPYPQGSNANDNLAYCCESLKSLNGGVQGPGRDTVGSHPRLPSATASSWAYPVSKYHAPRPPHFLPCIKRNRAQPTRGERERHLNHRFLCCLTCHRARR